MKASFNRTMPAGSAIREQCWKADSAPLGRHLEQGEPACSRVSAPGLPQSVLAFSRVKIALRPRALARSKDVRHHGHRLRRTHPSREPMNASSSLRNASVAFAERPAGIRMVRAPVLPSFAVNSRRPSAPL